MNLISDENITLLHTNVDTAQPIMVHFSHHNFNFFDIKSIIMSDKHQNFRIFQLYHADQFYL